MRAHRSVIALVVIALWSLLPVGSARATSADAVSAEQDAQGANDQIPAAWRNLPRVQIAVDGATSPARIPDNLAFRHFIRATASSASAADIRRRELFLTTAGLSVADRLSFVNALGDVALPAMRRVLQATTRFDSDIARGLMRIGTESAESVLEDMAASPQPERSAIARDTLRRLNAR